MREGGKKGFTLVEVALSMGFIAVLSVTMILLINDTVATYRRGLTLNNVSSSGTALVNELKASVQDAPVGLVDHDCDTIYKEVEFEASRIDCKNDKATNFMVLQRRGDVIINDDQSTNERLEDIPVYGAVCTGAYSYIWNSGYFFRKGEAKVVEKGTNTELEKAIFVYNQSDGENVQPSSYGFLTSKTTVNNFRLLKIKDSQRAVCKTMNRKIQSNNTLSDTQYDTYQPKSYFEGNLINTFDITNPTGATSDYSNTKIYYYKTGLRGADVTVVYADDTTNPLALYDLTVTPPASDESDKTAFYTGSFVLGTLQGGINVKRSGNFCKTPEGYTDEEFDYCAINKFNFAAQARGV